MWHPVAPSKWTVPALIVNDFVVTPASNTRFDFTTHEGVQVENAQCVEVDLSAYLPMRFEYVNKYGDKVIGRYSPIEFKRMQKRYLND